MGKKVHVYETDVTNGIYLKEKEPLFFRADKKGNEGQEDSILNVYDQVKYQEILGFGGAFTEASAVNFTKLTDEQKEEVLNAYFDTENGIGYNFCRTTINSCDFSTEMYSYDDTPEDYELKDFSINRDKRDLIPMILASQEKAEDMLIYASPWSPPAWMKTNGKMNKGGSLRKECQEAWARYTAKYLQEYEKEGIRIWGVTIQNEAKAAQGWESCIYEAGEERDFVTGYLKPAYERAGVGDRKVFFWDHNKERVVDRCIETMCNDRARAAFDGVAVHWYSGDHFSALSVAHDLFPDKLIIATEACKGKDRKYAYASGEKYAHDIIGDLNNWVSAWTDWNMLLDETGGPDHWTDEQLDFEHVREEMEKLNLKPDYKDEKFLDFLAKVRIWIGESPIMSHHDEKKIVYASSYYYVGHFSKFIKRGAKRIGSSIYTNQLEVCAFLNPNGEKVAVVINSTNDTKKVSLRYMGELADYMLQPHSIVTFVY
ncbi:MAG: srfJ [Herbinix sp.]|jgi:glucosylceramidase|nr:srfJ [Herbinix sp.]